MTEEEIIGFLEKFSFSSPEVIKGIGDDCAVVEAGDRWFLFTKDALVEGVHFSLAYFSPYFLGRKLAAVNLSDIAAMGGRPRFAFLTLALPRAPEKSFLEEFFKGLTEKLASYGALLLGGDTVRNPGHLFLDLALVGESPPGAVIFREGAQAGDLLFVSRALGASAAALELLSQGKSPPEAWLKAHLDPEPEIELGRILAEEGLARAMLDLSDGLLLDLARLCRANRVGAELYAEAIPLAVKPFPGLSRPPLAYALSGGEDFALLWATPPEKGRALEARLAALGRKVYLIGRLLPQEEEIWWHRPDGGRERLSPRGFDHFLEERRAMDDEEL